LRTPDQRNLVHPEHPCLDQSSSDRSVATGQGWGPFSAPITPLRGSLFHADQHAKLADIEALAAAGVVVFAPVPKPRVAARDPQAPREGDGPGVVAWRRRMGGEAVHKERAAAAECVNARCRDRGLLRFLVRGLEKAKAVGLRHALAHNMACTGRLLAT
jgi:hypothetical protein